MGVIFLLSKRTVLNFEHSVDCSGKRAPGADITAKKITPLYNRLDFVEKSKY